MAETLKGTGMRKVIPYHVMIGSRNFVGMAKEVKEFEPMVWLKEPVNVIYRNEGSQQKRTMILIDSDSDYNGKKIPIFLGPGVVLFEINEMSEMYKQYLEVKSSIIVPNGRLD